MTFDETTLAQSGGNTPPPVDYDPNEFWLRTLLRWYIGLVIRPSPTIREIVERRTPLWYGPLILTVGTSVAAIITSMSLGLLDDRTVFISLTDSPGANLLSEIITTLIFCGMVVSCITVWGAVLHWIGKISRGSAKFMATVGAVMPIPIVTLALYAVGIGVVGILLAWNRSDIRTDELALYSFGGFGLVGLLWAAELVTDAIKLGADGDYYGRWAGDGCSRCRMLLIRAAIALSYFLLILWLPICGWAST